MGKPKKYPTVKLLKDAVDKYFEENQEVVSLAGLCCELDLTYEGLSEYGRRPAYSAIVKNAKQRVERWVNEQGMLGKINPTMAIINLKANFKWNDKAGEQQQEKEDSDDMLKKLAEILPE